MLDIDIDTKGGILFVRLFGNLTKDTKRKINKELLSLICDIGINNLVINIQNVFEMDSEGLNTIIKCYRLCGKSMFCISPNQENSFLNFKYVFDEMSAYNSIKS